MIPQEQQNTNKNTNQSIFTFNPPQQQTSNNSSSGSSLFQFPNQNNQTINFNNSFGVPIQNNQMNSNIFIQQQPAQIPIQSYQQPFNSSPINSFPQTYQMPQQQNVFNVQQPINNTSTVPKKRQTNSLFNVQQPAHNKKINVVSSGTNQRQQTNATGIFGPTTYTPPSPPIHPWSLFNINQDFNGYRQKYAKFTSNQFHSMMSHPNDYISLQIPGHYNDDQNLIQMVKPAQKSKVQFDFDIKAQRSQIKLKQTTVLPAMVSLKANGGERTSADIICIIDISGSMSGQKINLVRSTMKVLVQNLTQNDRLSIILFQTSAYRVCQLKKVSKQNLSFFEDHIQHLYASGGNAMMLGIQMALKTIRERKVANKVTSIFLLGDGQDPGTDIMLKRALKQPKNKDLGVFSIHTFGYGSDHDQVLMSKICQIKDGAFYYIKQLSKVDEAFVHALGGVLSVSASQVQIRMRLVVKGLVEGIKIQKCFGPSWIKLNEKQYQVKTTQVISGLSKDYVFQLSVPTIDAVVGDIDRQHLIIQAYLIAKGVNKEVIQYQKKLFVTLINQNQNIAQINENVEVIQNYLRVKAAEAIEINMKKAQANQLNQASKGIDQMIGMIQNSKKARPQKMQHLIEDLNKIKNNCSSKQAYHQQGKKWMVQAQSSHMNANNFGYSNAMQCNMVSERISKKSNNPFN